MTRDWFSAPCALICANQVSCVARDDVVSDSAKFRITSRNEGTDPVVKALMRGMVMVGAEARAVNGTAAPASIKLFAGQFYIHRGKYDLRQELTIEQI